ncbi:WD repeat-containing protein 3 [Microplitis mediator]|uniref:WD repeat-containing protein 3 n=1 Tax=Microplitis mediator TaxID=375433 RepID=UPI00255541E1|nr:WD repeat-containing protein 3 [Microplitis mediator]
MGLTKQYLRFVPTGNLNIITSPKCNVVFVVLEGQEGRFVAAGACEHVIIWDLRLGEKAQVLTGEKSDVTQLATSPNNRHIAVGYADGTIKTYDLRSGENISIFVGHKSEITTLAYDDLGHRLASGSKDTDIIIWDVVAETGVSRLSGHKGIVTKVSFMKENNILISSSKDTFVKFWDLDTDHNFLTLVGHRSEVWGFTLVKNDKYLITGCNDYELRVWKIFYVENNDDDDNTLNIGSLNINKDETNDLNYPLRCEKIGSILRAGHGRIVSLTTDITNKIIACHGTKNKVELFYMISDDEVRKKINKRLNKEKNKALKAGKDDSNISLEASSTLHDEVRRLAVINAPSKVKSIDLVMGRGDELRVCVGLDNNALKLYSLSINEERKLTKKKEERDDITCIRSIEHHGHRTDIRAICFSSDNLAFATASGDSIKLWNRPSLTCLRTVECGYALALTFVPGDRHLIVGMKDGKILIVDIASGDMIESFQAHEQELWSIVLFPNMKGVASGSADKTVKFWDFELIEDQKTNCKVLGLIHTKTLNLEEGVLCVKISPNSRFIAVSLLDSTVKIFYLDTFKFFLSLYGHKLPVLCMDISSDSSLIATGSADRNIKIWGMDFGDCHKSLFAHDDSVMGLCFVPKTHYLFTCSKDGKLKEWDADNYQKIITLQGHSGEAWCCAVSPNGVFVASCGADKVIRLYEKSSEPLVLEDEAEEERERLENELATGETTAVPGQKQQLLPSRKTVNSEKAAELILECLDVIKAYNEELEGVKPPNAAPPLPLLMQHFNCKTTDEYLLETFKRIRASDMEETLLLLPYADACQILEYLPKLLKSEYQTELLVRLALSLIQAHHEPIVANSQMLPILEEVRDLAMEKITKLRDTVGYNLHGMSFLQRALEEKEGVTLFRDATKKRKNRVRNRRNKEQALKRALLTL